MKKVFMTAAALCMLAISASFVSCDPNKAQCWKMKVTLQDGTSREYFFYGTGAEADAQMDVYQKTGGVKQVSHEQTFMSKEDCKN